MVSDSRCILVTGASSGIGEAIVAHLLRDGQRVIGIGRKAHSRFDAEKNFHYERVDLSDLASLPEALKDLSQRYPDIDGLVCNAGRGHFGSLEEFSYKQIDELIGLNFTSQVYLVRAFMPALKKRGYGDVILIGSEAALSGGRRGAVYSATKFALRGFAQALRDEAGKSGIRVTIINPGMVKTAFFDKLAFEPGQEDCNHILPSDVADAATLVLSSRPGIVFDEINLSPLKKVIQFKKTPP